MYIQKWKSSLGIQKNSIYLNIILGLLIFISCKTPQYKEINCIQDNSFNFIYDSFLIEDNKWILIVLDISKRDYKGEIINNSELYFLELINNNYKIYSIKIENRDDYPFKPISIAYDKQNNIVYVLNIAFQNQRSIELYKIESDKLIFQRRYRSEKFKNLVSLIFYNNFLLGLNNIKFWQTNPTFIKINNKKFEYIKKDIFNGYKLKSLNNFIFVLIPENKNILILDNQFNIIKKLSFDMYPVDIFYENDNFYILLVSSFKNYFKNLENLEKTGNSYIYIINKNYIKNYNFFSLYDTFFKKYQISKKTFFNIFYEKTKHGIQLYLNHFNQNSERCILENLDNNFK